MSNRLVYILIAAVLSSCASKDSDTNPSQVLARVNGDEITVFQLNEELHKVSIKDGNGDEVKRKMLSGMIDRQLLVQEAIKLNLDRTPEVVDAVSSAKSQIYAQAYLNKKLGKLPPATEEEIQQFITDHPEIFIHRKVITTEDIIFESQPTKIDLTELESNATNLDQLKAILSAKKVEFSIANSKFSTDMLSKDVLQKLSNVKTGDLLFAHDDAKVVVKSVTNIEDIPMPNMQSIELATQYVNQKKQKSFITDEITRLKKLSKIDVFDEHPEVNQEGK